MKSTEGDHRKAADVLKKALGYHARTEQGDRLRSILSLKGRISYGGHLFTLDKASICSGMRRCSVHRRRPCTSSGLPPKVDSSRIPRTSGALRRSAEETPLKFRAGRAIPRCRMLRVGPAPRTRPAGVEEEIRLPCGSNCRFCPKVAIKLERPSRTRAPVASDWATRIRL